MKCGFYDTNRSISFKFPTFLLEEGSTQVAWRAVAEGYDQLQVTEGAPPHRIVRDAQPSSRQRLCRYYAGLEAKACRLWTTSPSVREMGSWILKFPTFLFEEGVTQVAWRAVAEGYDQPQVTEGALWFLLQKHGRNPTNNSAETRQKHHKEKKRKEKERKHTSPAQCKQLYCRLLSQSVGAEILPSGSVCLRNVRKPFRPAL
jgi:hypothetical protein